MRFLTSFFFAPWCANLAFRHYPRFLSYRLYGHLGTSHIQDKTYFLQLYPFIMSFDGSICRSGKGGLVGCENIGVFLLPNAPFLFFVKYVVINL